MVKELNRRLDERMTVLIDLDAVIMPVKNGRQVPVFLSTAVAHLVQYQRR
jgi:hypothetical protein